MDDLAALRPWLALNYLPGIPYAHILTLLHDAGSPESLFCQHDLSDKLGAEHPRDSWVQLQQAASGLPVHHAIEQDLHVMDQSGIRLVTLHDLAYPPALKELVRPPLMLFVRGNVEVLKATQLAVVGARKASKLALENARAWSQELAAQGLAITSGLALGIDGAAHRGALAAGGKTIAVLAHGLAELYPPQHRELAEDIVSSGGALVSEFPPTVVARKEFFPRRNRIISGLSAGVLVVEAALKSGSLITARYALEQNRDVFAVPGSVNNEMVKGCHRLIKEGAYLVESAEDILDAMNWQQARQQSLFGAPPEAVLERPGSQLLTHISFDLAHVDELVQVTGLPVAELSGELLLLEAEGYIEAVGGNYRRIR